MRSGWEQAGAEQQRWYQRSVVSGPISFCIDLWAIDDDNHEWAFCVNNGSRDRFVARSPDRAMESAEVLLAGHLRSAARLCKQLSD